MNQYIYFTKKYLKHIVTICFTLILISCTDSANSDLEKEKSQKIEKLLLEMKTLGDAKGKVVVFKLENLDKEDYSELIEVVPYTKKVYTFNHPDVEPNTDNYTVTCNWGDGSQTITECGSDAACAGSATWNCVENGGCATICNAKIMYKPSNLL